MNIFRASVSADDKAVMQSYLSEIDQNVASLNTALEQLTEFDDAFSQSTLLKSLVEQFRTRK